MLAAYRLQTQALLQNPGAPTALYALSDIDRWINLARGQLAGEGECIRAIATISTVAGQMPYNFADLNTGVSATNGIQGAINVRRVAYQIASGARWIPPRPWEWFDLYILNTPVPQQGPPTVWSQYAQGAAPGATGSAAGGSFYINAPDIVYTLNCDCTCYPIDLVDDTTVEAIPYLWTDAVPFFAAYYALLSAQTNERMADAERYYNHYQTFVERARRSSNPSVGRWQYSQASDPAQAAKMGIKPAGIGGGAG